MKTVLNTFWFSPMGSRTHGIVAYVVSPTETNLQYAIGPVQGIHLDDEHEVHQNTEEEDALYIADHGAKISEKQINRFFADSRSMHIRHLFTITKPLKDEKN